MDCSKIRVTIKMGDLHGRIGKSTSVNIIDPTTIKIHKQEL